MSPTATTQEKLLDAALRLYADRGVFQVSLAEIVREAGQRNASAIHYHFGSRDQILMQLMAPYVGALRERRLALLERARRQPDDDVRSVVDALVRPVAELARRGWRERAYLRIGLELVERSERVAPELVALLNESGAREAIELLVARVPPLPADLLRWRLGICVGFVGRAAADRARDLERESGATPLTDDEFTADLVDIYIGAITSPSCGLRVGSAQTDRPGLG